MVEDRIRNSQRGRLKSQFETAFYLRLFADAFFVREKKWLV